MKYFAKYYWSVIVVPRAYCKNIVFIVLLMKICRGSVGAVWFVCERVDDITRLLIHNFVLNILKRNFNVFDSD